MGAKVGKDMKAITAPIAAFTNEQIATLEGGNTVEVTANGTIYQISAHDVEIKTADIPGWQIMSDTNYTVALDLELTHELKQEGIARELVNKIQNLRKEHDFVVTDKIIVTLESHNYINEVLLNYNEYICGEILADAINTTSELNSNETIDINQHIIKIKLSH